MSLPIRQPISSMPFCTPATESISFLHYVTTVYSKAEYFANPTKSAVSEYFAGSKFGRIAGTRNVLESSFPFCIVALRSG